MKALLLFPASPDVFFNLHHVLGVPGKKALVPPLGLLTVAALLPKEWDKRFFDLHARQPSDDDIEWADIAFISLTAGNVQDESALAMIARLKKAGVRIVAGGTGFFPEADAFAAQLETYKDVDHFVLREAEITLPLFLADLAQGQPKRQYTTTEWADLTKSPIPMYDLLHFEDYAEMDVQMFRGCPYGCAFCVIPALMGRPGRAKTVAQFLAELQRLFDLGWRGFVEINDDNLIADLKLAKRELLPALVEWQIERGMPFKFHVCIDVRVGEDDELLALLYASGFHSVFLGIENLDPECLDEVHKTVNATRDMDAIVQRIQRAGILVYCGLMVGFDHDKPAVFEKMAAFVERNGIIMPSLTKVNAVPGTELYQRMKLAGRIDHTAIGDAHKANIRDVPMGAQALDRGYVDLMERLWTPKYFYRRVRTALEVLKAPVHTDKPSLANLRILLRIVLRVGVLSEERREFWSGLAWTVIHRPKLLPVYFAVQPLGYGFRKRCAEVFDDAYRARSAAAAEPKRAARPAPGVAGQAE
ncbi:MAG: B12-binding domain-containing radical SAM protein [Myxococcales bacterium]|nr:B12-binding domain-containing radical SAM protein [Myxococcales bacterium]